MRETMLPVTMSRENQFGETGKMGLVALFHLELINQGNQGLRIRVDFKSDGKKHVKHCETRYYEFLGSNMRFLI